MEGVGVEEGVRTACKRFPIKGNGVCGRSARGFDGHQAKLQGFFFPENNPGGDMRNRKLKDNSSWIADKTTEPLFSFPRTPFRGTLGPCWR